MNRDKRSVRSDAVIQPVKLHADMAQIRHVGSSVVKLMAGQYKLRRGKRDQRQPRAAALSVQVKKTVAEFSHSFT